MYDMYTIMCEILGQFGQRKAKLNSFEVVKNGKKRNGEKHRKQKHILQGSMAN